VLVPAQRLCVRSFPCVGPPSCEFAPPFPRSTPRAAPGGSTKEAAVGSSGDGEARGTCGGEGGTAEDGAAREAGDRVRAACSGDSEARERAAVGAPFG
jgi:hypothetical protein